MGDEATRVSTTSAAKSDRCVGLYMALLTVESLSPESVGGVGRVGN